MFNRALAFLFALSTATAFEQRQLLSEDHAGMQVARRLERQLQFDDLPDICQGFELIIDEIPEGRDSCDCDGTSVNCFFRAHCEPGHENEPHCMDAVEYIVAFENDMITVESCALITEGGFEETCAKVSLAGDLQLAECMQGSYGGKPCDCTVCEGRGSLLLDCSAYDPRAVTSCQAMGVGNLTPLSAGFNTTAAAPEGSSEESQSQDEDVSDTQTSIDDEESASGSRQTTAAFTAFAALASVVALL